MSTIKANNISPIGSTLTLGGPVAGLSIAGGLTVGGVAYFSSGVTFADPVAFTDGITAGTLYVSKGSTFSSLTTFSSGIKLGSSTFSTPSGTAPLYGVRAWVRFTVAHSSFAITVQGQGNVSSVTRNALGDYTITFTTALPSNYAVAGVANENNLSSTGGQGGVYQTAVNLYSNATATTTSCRITLANIDANVNADPEVCSLIFVG